MASLATSEREVWDRHWRAFGAASSFAGRLASLVRRGILAPAVRHFAARYFPPRGVLVEAGCGTGEASAAVPAAERTLVGLDFSLPVLLAGRGRSPHRLRIAADLRALPFADGTVAGTWNLGVLEHFAVEEGLAILRELRRALAPGGVVLLFWPPSFGSSRWLLAPYEALRSALAGRPYRVFPDEVNRLPSRRRGRWTLAAAGFEPLQVALTPRDAFIHLVLVGRRPA